MKDAGDDLEPSLQTFMSSSLQLADQWKGHEEFQKNGGQEEKQNNQQPKNKAPLREVFNLVLISTQDTIQKRSNGWGNNKSLVLTQSLLELKLLTKKLQFVRPVLWRNSCDSISLFGKDKNICQMDRAKKTCAI